jgi:hypothetical protein
MITTTPRGHVLVSAPAAQFGDSGGGPNTVSGKAIGECSTLVG